MTNPKIAEVKPLSEVIAAVEEAIKVECVVVTTAQMDALLEAARECEALREQLAEAKNVQSHTVTMPDGSTPLGQCTFDGCQYGQITELRASLAARESEHKFLGNQFLAALTVLERIAKYPHTRADELGYAGCRELAKEAIAACESQALAIEQRIREGKNG